MGTHLPTRHHEGTLTNTPTHKVRVGVGVGVGDACASIDQSRSAGEQHVIHVKIEVKRDNPAMIFLHRTQG